MTPDEINQMSLQQLSSAYPLFIAWIVFAMVNIFSIVISIYILNVAKLMSKCLRKIVILHLSAEAAMSIESMFIAVYHIYMHLVEKSAAMKPFDCFKYVGTTYIFMHFSYWMVLLTSIDRSIAIFSPNFYKTGEHTAILNKIVILIACFELAELFAFYIDNFAQEFLLFCSVTSAMGVHSQFYATLVNTTLSVISPTIYCICFAYLLFQRYQKRANFSADLVAVKRRLKNRVTWSLAFMATWQVMTIAIASAYSFLCYNLAYNGGKAPSRFAGCLVFMSGTMFFVGGVIYLEKFRSRAAMILCCKRFNSVGNITPVVAWNATTANT